MNNKVLKIASYLILCVFLSSYIITAKNFEPLPTSPTLTAKEIKPISQVVNYQNNNIVVDSFSQDSLIQLLIDLNVKYPHIVLAQSILETGHYKSKVFKENHNLFGMKEARVRIHTAKGTRNGHAYYLNWEESVYDYAFYQSTYYSDIRSEKHYYRKLGSSYAESKNYVNTLKEIVKRENLKDMFLD